VVPNAEAAKSATSATQGYLETLVSAAKGDWSDSPAARRAVVERVERDRPGDELQFLPVAAGMGLHALTAA
jgi:hypothetical protein